MPVRHEPPAVRTERQGHTDANDYARHRHEDVAQETTACAVAPLSEAALEVVAERFRILAEPMRVRLLAALRDGERCVSELVADLGAAQPNVSRHLHLLEQAGIISHRRAGNLVFYFVIDESVFALFGDDAK